MAEVGVRVGSTWLHSLGYGHIGDLEYSTVYGVGGGGLLTASFSLGLPRGFTHPALRQGQVVTLSMGGWPIGSGILAEPDRDEWRFTVDGLKRLAEKMVAVDGSGNPSTDLSVIIPAACDTVTRSPGLPWNYVTSELPVGAVSTTSEAAANLNFIQQVLDKYCELNGKRWVIDRHGYLRFVTDPTTPTLALTPGVPSIATADDDYVMRVYTRRVSALTSGEPSAWAANKAEDTAAGARWGVAESIEDITDLGLLTNTQGNTIAASILAAGRARPAYTEAVAPAPDQIATPGGSAAPHWLVPAGSMVRHHGWLDSDGDLAFGKTVDWVIGSKTWRQSDRSLTIAPIGLAARTTAQVAAKQAREAMPGFK